MSDQVITCIRNRRYLEAANLIVKGIMKEKIHTLSTQKRDSITRRVAQGIRSKHEKLRSFYAGTNIAPMVIAEEVYGDIMLELMPEPTDSQSLAEQLDNEEH